MKIRKLSSCILSLLLASLFVSSCGLAEYGLDELFSRKMDTDERAGSLTVLTGTEVPSVAAGDEYDVLLIADVHFGNENKGKNGPRRETEWFDKLQDDHIIDNVKFAICLGDVADHGTLEEFTRFNTEIRDKFSMYGIPLYSVTGNHDLYNSGWAFWTATQNPGTSFYKFTTPSFSWYFLDSGSGSLGDIQFTLLKKDLKTDSNKKLFFTHVPLYADDEFCFIMQNTDERNKLISLLASTDTVYFVDAHVHGELSTNFGKFTEYNIPSLLEQYSFGILHIDEAAGTARITCMSY